MATPRLQCRLCISSCSRNSFHFFDSTALHATYALVFDVCVCAVAIGESIDETNNRNEHSYAVPNGHDDNTRSYNIEPECAQAIFFSRSGETTTTKNCACNTTTKEQLVARIRAVISQFHIAFLHNLSLTRPTPPPLSSHVLRFLSIVFQVFFSGCGFSHCDSTIFHQPHTHTAHEIDSIRVRRQITLWCRTTTPQNRQQYQREHQVANCVHTLYTCTCDCTIFFTFFLSLLDFQ